MRADYRQVIDLIESDLPLDHLIVKTTLEEALARREGLNFDLVPWLMETERFMYLNHPLVQQIPFIPEIAAMANQQFYAKVRAVRDARDRGDWHQFVFLHERPWRAPALGYVMSCGTSAKTSMGLAGQVWIDSENIRENQDFWDEFLHGYQPYLRFMMHPDEHDALRALPGMVEVYQGCTDDRDDGWSWTTDRDVAVWFARRFARMEDGTPVVRAANIPREDIACYFTRRNEAEALIDPELIRGEIVEVLDLDTIEDFGS